VNQEAWEDTRKRGSVRQAAKEKKFSKWEDSDLNKLKYVQGTKKSIGNQIVSKKLGIQYSKLVPWRGRTKRRNTRNIDKVMLRERGGGGSSHARKQLWTGILTPLEKKEKGKKRTKGKNVKIW